MVKIRLRRTGRVHLATYRIVVSDSRSPRDGRFIDEIGVYEPTNKTVQLKVNNEKALLWLQKGAQPTDTVRGLLSQAGVLKEFHEKKGK